ncbi:NIM1-INTERACTING 2-like [Olea europaea subsp. europaea]|uniref:NIM1-INTERACTING 2-like n=1 Tax=Olea europaea subsp. europaea TaxID=158383 RepID=A0A8S0Q497_OLEEU|nr:NIM1-INTERACTING 2-like [Olea europaea subsp. europaea]
MEVAKRKRPNDEDADGKKCKGQEDDNGVRPLPEDDEVEEFFAILRRIHVAVKYFKKRNRHGDCESTMTAWSPSFQREDFEEVNVVKKEGSMEGTRDKIAGTLDLNSEPAGERSNLESV